MINDIFTILIRGANAVNTWFLEVLNAMGAFQYILGIIAVSVAFRFLIYPMLKPSAGHSDTVKKTKDKE